MSLRLGVLISGSGSNLQSIMDRIEQGILDAEISLVVSNEPGAYGLKRAEAQGIATKVVEHRQFKDRRKHDQAVVNSLKQAGAEAVCLAGYMRLVSPDFIQAFSGQVLNIHPAILPSFKGTLAQKKAALSGVKIAGATVHFVVQDMDSGPIIIQAALGVQDSETAKSLQQRILGLEHRIYPQAIQWLAQGRLKVEEGKVHLQDGSGPGFLTVREGGEDLALVCPGLEPGF